MIKTKKLVPSVYYDKSRDFQLLGRTYDIIFNYLKTNIDTIYNNPLSKNSDKSLLDLMTLTLGFKSQHNYNVNQLAAMCSSFMVALKNKGNIQSIRLAIDTLLQAEGISQESISEVDYENHVLVIYIPTELKDLNLFNDLLSYILPAGMSCTLIRQPLLGENASTEMVAEDEISYLSKANAISTSTVPQYDGSVEPSDVEPGRIDNSVIIPYQTTEYEETILPRESGD